MGQKDTKANSACLIADDHASFRRGLAVLVRDLLKIPEIVEAEDFEGALEQISDERLVLAIVDLRMPGVTGAQDIGRLRTIRPELPLAVMSASEDRDDMLGCLAAGVHGYVLKNAEDDEVVSALTQIMNGQIYAPPELAAARPASAETDGGGPALTPRQTDVLELLVAGKTNKEIARDLDLSESTVKIHVAALFRALGVRNRVEVVEAARKLKF